MAHVKVRFPPSPTGYCHVGTARMAIINYLFAKKHGGTIVFRSEDTDKERSKKEFEDDIIDQLHWLGLSWDEFYRTTELVGNHTKAIKSLIASDKAYISNEDSKKAPGTSVAVVRLRNPGRTVTFTDVVRGDITFDTTELGDFVIARAIDDPVYQLAVVVDDAEEGITHVIRGEDHISNTPRHILIQEALGYARPIYAHFPILLGSDRSKLSKRTGDVAVRSYRESGFLSEALLNYIAVLGWTPPSGKEALSLAEMIDEFELTDLHKSGAIFDIEKLRWFNRHYIEHMTDEDFLAHARGTLSAALDSRQLSYTDRALAAIVPLIRERISVVGDISGLMESGELDCLFRKPHLEPSLIHEKRSSPEIAHKHLSWLKEHLDVEPPGNWNAEAVKGIVWDYATAEGRGGVLWPLRYALSGREKSPDPFTIAGIIGKTETLARIDTALKVLTV